MERSYSVTETSRSVALAALMRIDHDGAYANLVLPALLSRSKLSDPDRRFVTELVYGTTRMRRACDALIDRFVVSEPDDATRTLLRLGAYQLVFAGVAPHAAVSATVDLATRKTSGFVNAVLRKVSTVSMIWPNDAVRLSYPDWISERFHGEMSSDDAVAALERMNVPSPVSTRSDGYVQDESSQWVAASVGGQRGDLVLDLCAGPGGKATGLAASGATVIGADLQPTRAGLVAKNAERMGYHLPVVAADGVAPPFLVNSFDRVLLDAPCSGLGALRRRADARWRITSKDVKELAVLQKRLLAASAPLVKPGGVLVYSVCTITAAESTDHGVPEGFDVVGRDGDSGLPALGDDWNDFGIGHRVLPHHADTDGMVLIRYRRRHD
jgi:16S rRNA (cytosine967-C5)-methyltransferase